MPELLPEVERVLYLDVDTLALDDLAPLWRTDLGDAYVGAVTNVFQPDHLFHAAELGIRPEDYFNSGVLLLDLAALRRDGCAERAARGGARACRRASAGPTRTRSTSSSARAATRCTRAGTR